MRIQCGNYREESVEEGMGGGGRRGMEDSPHCRRIDLEGR